MTELRASQSRSQNLNHHRKSRPLDPACRDHRAIKGLLGIGCRLAIHIKRPSFGDIGTFLLGSHDLAARNF